MRAHDFRRKAAMEFGLWKPHKRELPNTRTLISVTAKQSRSEIVPEDPRSTDHERQTDLS